MTNKISGSLSDTTVFGEVNQLGGVSENRNQKFSVITRNPLICYFSDCSICVLVYSPRKSQHTRLDDQLMAVVVAEEYNQ